MLYLYYIERFFLSKVLNFGLYNKEMDIAIGLNDFFSQIDFKFSKPQLKVLPHLIMAAITEV